VDLDVSMVGTVLHQTIVPVLLDIQEICVKRLFVIQHVNMVEHVDLPIIVLVSKVIPVLLVKLSIVLELLVKMVEYVQVPLLATVPIRDSLEITAKYLNVQLDVNIWEFA